MKYYFLSALFLNYSTTSFCTDSSMGKSDARHAQPIGTLINEITTSITTDAAGNVYVAGVFENSMDFKTWGTSWNFYL